MRENVSHIGRAERADVTRIPEWFALRVLGARTADEHGPREAASGDIERGKVLRLVPDAPEPEHERTFRRGGEVSRTPSVVNDHAMRPAGVGAANRVEHGP